MDRMRQPADASQISGPDCVELITYCVSHVNLLVRFNLLSYSSSYSKSSMLPVRLSAESFELILSYHSVGGSVVESMLGFCRRPKPHSAGRGALKFMVHPDESIGAWNCWLVTA
jgi:hypothetical protein